MSQQNSVIEESSRSKSYSNKQIGNYTLGKNIGEGTFGKVKLGYHIITNQKVAIKILEKDKIQDVSDVERVAREIHILKIIRHPNLCQLYEIIETPMQLYLIMEFAPGGELFDYIVQNQRLKEREACKFFHQILNGVEYIQKLHIVHRDLKPENLLLGSKKEIKLVDFGLSNTYKTGETLKTACGSPCYAAPEMIAGKRYLGERVDVWSCGVILFAMICGYLPFEDPNTANLYKKIISGIYQVPKTISSEARDLIRNILNTDPDKRFTIREIRSHIWMSQVKHELIPGIVIGVDKIPINEDIVQQMEKYKMNSDYTIKCLESNKHNNVTTTYYLLCLQNNKISAMNTSADHIKPTSRHIYKLSLGNVKQTVPQVDFVHPRSRRYVSKIPPDTGGSSSKEQKDLNPIPPKTVVRMNRFDRDLRAYQKPTEAVSIQPTSRITGNSFGNGSSRTPQNDAFSTSFHHRVSNRQKSSQKKNQDLKTPRPPSVQKQPMPPPNIVRRFRTKQVAKIPEKPVNQRNRKISSSNGPTPRQVMQEFNKALDYYKKIN